MTTCHEHGGHDAAGTCRRCLRALCRDLLVYSYGRSKPPYCLDCAVEQAAVPAGRHERTDEQRIAS